MATESFDTWNDWFMNADAKNAQIKLDGPGLGLGYYFGKWLLSSFKLGGTRGQKITVDLTLVNDGAVTFVDVP
jgi:hypothetical protein